VDITVSEQRAEMRHTEAAASNAIPEKLLRLARVLQKPQKTPFLN
jgi:hypothetical protein